MKKLDFMHSIKAFSKWNYNMLRRLYLNSEPFKKFHWNQIVFAENAKPEHMYVIIDGEFRVTKEVQIAEEEVFDKEMAEFEKEKGSMLIIKPQCTKLIELAILARGEIFGEDDLFLARDHFTTVTCNSQVGTVLEVKPEVKLWLESPDLTSLRTSSSLS